MSKVAKDNSKESCKQECSSSKKKIDVKKIEKDVNELKVEEKIHVLENSNDVDSNVEALEYLKSLVTNVTGLASIPPTIRMLYNRYEQLINIYQKKADEKVKKLMASVISLVAVTHPLNSEGDVLKFYLLSSMEPFKTFSITYVRELVKNIILLWKNKVTSQTITKETLLKLILDCAVYFVTQNAEIEACDLLIETEQLKDQIDSLKLIDNKCHKLCNYLIACLPYLIDDDKNEVLSCAANLCIKNNFLVEALYICLFQNNNDKQIEDLIYNTCQDVNVRKQMMIILARHNRQIAFKSINTQELELLGNTKLSSYFLGLAQSLDVMNPKSNENVLNSSKVNVPSSEYHLLYLGASFLSAFVNAGYGKDRMLSTPSGLALVEKHKNNEKISAAAAMGLVCLWNVENGWKSIAKYFNSKIIEIKAGSLLAYGVHCTGVNTLSDLAFDHLNPHVGGNDIKFSTASIVGLSIAYAGSNHQKSIDSIMKVMDNANISNELLTTSAIACGVIASSSGSIQVASKLVKLLKKPKLPLKDQMDIMLAIGLCFLTRSDLMDTHIKTLLEEVNNTSKQHDQLQIYIEMCAFVGSSNILKIQKMVNLVSMTKANQAKPSRPARTSRKTLKQYQDLNHEEVIQVLAVLGIGMLSIGDDLSNDMILRTYKQFLQYGDVPLKTATLLSLALIFISNPKMAVIEIISKHTHAIDFDVAIVSIFCLGLVGAGTGNTRILILLTKLTVYYSRKAEFQFAIRVAAGLLNLGKGLLSLSPLMELKIIRPTSITGLLVVLHQLLKPAYLIYSNHYYLYYLANSIQIKVLMTVNTELKFQPVTIRAGQALDTVGQVGYSRTITSFQTLDTPIILNRNEKAEIDTDKYIPLNPILEGCVIVKENSNPLKAKSK